MASNKEKILQAASELLLTKGLPALSVRAISRRAGLSTIAIYNHFQGKDGVLDALYIEGFGLVQQATEAVAHIEDPVAAARAAADNYLQIARDHESHYRLIFGEIGGDYTPSKEARQAARTAFDTLVTVVGRVLGEGVSVPECQRAALRLWATLHGYVSLRQHVVGYDLAYEQWKALAIESMMKALDQLVAEYQAVTNKGRSQRRGAGRKP